MKKLAILSLVISILLGMIGCKSTSFEPSEQLYYNYNNISARNCNFWIDGGALYYGCRTLFRNGYYSSNSITTDKLLDIDGASPWDVVKRENTLYLSDQISPGLCRLHAYDITTGVDRSLGGFSDVYRYFAIDQSLYYVQEAVIGSDWIQSLWVYSMDTDTKIRIAYSILGAGVIENNLTYIVQEGNEFLVYRCNASEGQSTLLTSFTYILNADEYVLDYVNFTSERIVLTVSDDINTKIVCFELESGHVITYPMTGWTSSVIAYDKYAFAVITDTTSDETKNWTNDLYRISLETGDTKKLGKLHGSVNTFISSDDTVYVVSSQNERIVYQYTSSGERKIAYRV